MTSMASVTSMTSLLDAVTESTPGDRRASATAAQALGESERTLLVMLGLVIVLGLGGLLREGQAMRRTSSSSPSSSSASSVTTRALGAISSATECTSADHGGHG